MKIRTVLAATAGFAVSLSSITPAMAYFRTAVPRTNTAQVTAPSSSSSSSMSSSSRVSLRSSKSSTASKKPAAKAVSSRPATTKELAMAQCMQAAAKKREDGIQLALDTFYNDMSTRLRTRREMIVKKWGDTNVKNRNAGFKSIWHGFGQSWRMSSLLLREQRNAAWLQFRTDRNNCGLSGRDEEGGGLGLDSQF